MVYSGQAGENPLFQAYAEKKRTHPAAFMNDLFYVIAGVLSSN
jgi:hypothetical protein